MKQLTDEQLAAHSQTIIKDWRTHTLADTPARFEAPLGEWISNLVGFAGVLRMQNRLPKVEPITGKERFRAQGLEGKMVYHTDLATAVTYWAQCPHYRASVWV